ncbi:60S ribosome subunit biogenesis protein NIP7 homolog [Hibiscus syriacus]|uniref:60S ribosome subunit biogenesis protein NIP7 homolog n=1 Tax=Hibiscus syriacus TaxID=106335 RepID=UPI001920E6E5|nr:60S ribosome subunit biogenesis protein NIP7 homolog [Hibiscus syriacus]
MRLGFWGKGRVREPRGLGFSSEPVVQGWPRRWSLTGVKQSGIRGFGFESRFRVVFILGKVRLGLSLGLTSSSSERRTAEPMEALGFVEGKSFSLHTVLHFLSTPKILILTGPKLASIGTCIGRFTHGGNFHLTVECLNLLTANAKHKVWLKPTSGMSFLYANHVLKGGLGRITESIAPGDGVVFSMSDLPLGFGIAAKSTQDCRKLDPNAIVVLHQADIGEYLRMEIQSEQLIEE